MEKNNEELKPGSLSDAKARRKKFKAPNRMPTRKVVIQEEEKTDKIQNTFLSSTFPIIIIIMLLVLFGVFYYLFNNYKSVVIVDNEGYFISNNNNSILLGSKKKDDNTILNTINVKENETIYQTAFKYTIENNRKKEVNMLYPLFINNGLTIINYNENVNLINDKFERSIGYNGLVLTYGKAYDNKEYIQIDKEKYLLMSYKDGVNINLYDLNIKTALHEYNIPINSFIFFEENEISYYERRDNSFEYKSIKDIDYKSILNFHYEGGNEEYEFNYETFLQGIGTIYVVPEIIPDNKEEIKPGENEKEELDPSPNVPSKPTKPLEFVYIKPEVSIESFSANVYSMKNKITIKDPAGVIVKAPTFTLYSGGKIYSNRTFYSSGDIKISGLIPSTDFTIIGKYTYLAEDMETKKIVTFYLNTIRTKDLTSLSPIELSFENGLIYPKKIEVDKVKVISDLNSEAIMGVNKVSLNIDGTNYYLGLGDVSQIINGTETKISTSESLKSSQIIDYKFSFFDRAGNEIKSIKNTGQTRTSKRPPSISLRVKTNKVDNVEIGINLRNEDNIDLIDYKYSVVNSSGKIISQGKVNGNSIFLSGLSPDQIFNIKLTADLDIDDGQGLHNDYELASMDFTTKPITSLGYANITVKENKKTHNSEEFSFFVNSRKTDAILLGLITKISVYAYKADDNTLMGEIEFINEDVEKFKNRETLNVKFENLISNTKYNLIIKTTVEQGEEIYVFDSVYNILDFTTNKTPAIVNVTNSFTTETMLDFDMSVTDPDKSIISDYIRVELKDEENNIISLKTIDLVNNDVNRITYNNLEVNKFYTVNFYADEYNETNLNENYKYKYLISSYKAYTDEGISGKIELVSSIKKPTSTNIVDISSEVKWYQTEQYWTIPKTIDEEGNMHIYSKNGASAYTYDLSEYHGQLVTISFKVKTITNPYDFKLYFTQYFPGTTSNGYAKEITGVNTDTWTEFTYTFKVGALSYPQNNQFNHYSTKTYGKNYNDSAGFYITGGSIDLTEFVIKDLDIHVQYNKEPIDISNISLEPGYYNSNGTKNDSKKDFYVRTTDAIALEGGNYYSIDFDNTNEYQVYAYFYKPDGKYEKAWGHYGTESTFYVSEDRYIKFYFRYQNGNTILNPSDINNLRIYKYTNNNILANPDFTYDLETKISVNLVDSRDEIQDDNYFITIYDNNNNELMNDEYVELIKTNKLEKVIKKINLDENKDYIIALRIKIRDRYYTLNTFEVNTDNEVLSISTTNDWRYIQPNGNYIILNDIDFADYTDQRLGWGYRYFYGTIDFQGYKMKVYSSRSDGTSLTQFRRINRLEKGAVVKNIVIDADISNQSINNSINGIFGVNYGTIENVIINVTDSHKIEMPQLYTSILLETNAMGATVSNFIVNLKSDVYFYSDSGIISRVNHGTIKNGYIYGKDIVTSFTNGSNPARNIGMLFRYGGVKSIVDRVYSLSSIRFENNQSNDRGGIFGWETYGKVSNSYVIGDTNYLQPSYGPIIAHIQATGRFDNVFYISDNIYTSTKQQKASLVSVTDKQFQNDVLGDSFNVDELIDLGYYPQVKFTSTKMPTQEFIDLPSIKEEEYADIISMKVIEQTNNSAIISVNVNNILGEEITSILISNVKTEILSQTYQEGKSTVTLRVYEPDTFISRYQVRSISTRSTSGHTSTRRYNTGEKYLIVDFYNEIYSVEDFININKGLSQNYAIMNDLDFYGYVKIHINNFSGKLEGNNHILKNIDLSMAGKNGLFNQMNGTLQNIIFDSVFIKTTTSSQLAIVGYSNQNSVYYNVHVNNIIIEVPENMTRENVYVSGLVANSYASKIDYCSVSNITVTSNANLFSLAVGGLIGYSNASIINNSYASNVDLRIDNAASVAGLGGLVGREVSSVGIITDSYTTGKISSNSSNTGGIVGYTQGYLERCLSSVDVTSDMYYLGGLVGFSRANTDVVSNSIYLGNIYTGSADMDNVNRIVGNYETTPSNYAMSSSLINGVSSDKENGEIILSYNEYLKEETYKTIFSDYKSYDLSNVSKGVIPMLYAIDEETLMPYQSETKIFRNRFNINNFVIDKHADYASITMYLDNEEQLDISRIEVEGARIEVVRNINVDDITVYEFKLYPVKYYDNYKIANFYYLNNNNEEVKVEKNYRIDAIFYKNLSSFEDWQKVSKNDPENYLLTNNIDFTGRDKINTGLVFNRLETAGKDIRYTLSGLDLNITKNQNYNNVISKIVTSFKNITISDFTITDNTNSTNSYSNILLFNYANLDNLRFENITINSSKKHYVSIIGQNYASDITNITLESINVSGNQRVSGFISHTQSALGNNFNNINARDIHVNAIGAYSGGIFASFANYIASGNNPVYNNINISDSEIISSAHYVGGIVGYGDANHSKVSNVYVKGSYYVGGAIGQPASDIYNVIVENSLIEGTSNYIGGAIGYAQQNIYDTKVINSDIVGLTAETHSVGGLFGYKTGYTTARCGVINSRIVNNGYYTGGIGGQNTGGTLMSSFIDGSTITGNDYTGGLIGRITFPTVYINRVVNTIINSTKNYSGGIAGIFDNYNSYGSTNEATVREINIEGSTVKANSFAGGFFGKVTSPFLYANRVRRLFSDSEVIALDEANYGTAAGDIYNSEILKQPSVYIYENQILNGQKASSVINENQYGPNILDVVEFKNGTINSSGVAIENSIQTNYEFSDMIKLDKGKRYEIDVKHLKNSNMFNVYLYDLNGKFLYTISNGNTENYFGKYFDVSYINNLKFRVYKDCYIRIAFTDLSSLVSRTLKVVYPTNRIINKDNLLSADELRDRLTWSSGINDTSGIRYGLSKLNYDRSYWDFDVINSRIPSSIVYNDLVSNNTKIDAHVSGILKKGLKFDGIDDYAQINNFNLPSDGNFTFQTTINNYNVSKGFQWIISKRNPTAKNGGFGVFIHWGQIYVWIYNTWYGTGVYIPLNKDINLAVTYENNKYLKLYIDGNLLYSSTPNKKLVNDSSNTYLAYDDEYFDPSYRYIGTIKNIMTYNRVLSNEEIKNNVNASTGITDTNGLMNHFDLSNHTTKYDAYYPLLKWNVKTYEITDQPLKILPSLEDTSIFTGIGVISKSSLYSDIPNYHIYPSGIDTINIEFDEISKDMSFIYKTDGNEYKTKIEKRVYTLNYDFNSDASIIISNAFESKEIILDKNELSKQIAIINNNYYYINNNILYLNNDSIINDAVHIYNNLVLLKDNKVYNINTKNISNLTSNKGILDIENALYNSLIDGKSIKTYYNFTLVNDEYKVGQMIINNNSLYVFNNKDSKNDNIVFNNYNNLEYQIVLNNKGIIESYKEDIVFPSNFINANIKEIAFDINSDIPVIIVKYDSENIVVFDYVKGIKIFEYGDNVSASLFEFINSELRKSNIMISSSNKSYRKNKELLKELNNITDNNIVNKLDSYSNSDNKIGNKLNNKYISVYNTNTKTYEIFNTSELLNTKSDKIIDNDNSSEETIIETEKSKDTNIKSINNKLKSDMFLYNYFYINKKSSIISDKKLWIYGLILVTVIINLIVLSIKYGNKEVINEK